MGGRSSTPRTVQLDNDIPVGVITVSDDVVNRLKGLHSEGRCTRNLNLNHCFSMYFSYMVYVTKFIWSIFPHKQQKHWNKTKCFVRYFAARKQEGAQSEGHSGAAQPQVVTVYQGKSALHTHMHRLYYYHSAFGWRSMSTHAIPIIII